MTDADRPKHRPMAFLIRTIRATVQNFFDRDGFFLSAGIAYYGLFSIVPLALLTVSVAGFFVGTQKAEAEIAEALSEYVGPEVASLLSKVFEDMSSRGSTTGTLIGAALLLYGATRLFLRLQKSFDLMWGVRVIDEGSPRKRLRSQLVTVSMILLPALILFAAVLFSTGANWLHDTGLIPWEQTLLENLSPLAVIWAAVAIVTLVLPHVRLSLRDCWATSMLAALACYGTTRGFGAFLTWSSSSTRVVLTSVSALMTLIVWVNVIAIILLLCVSLTRVRYVARGKTVQPYDYAKQFRVIVE